jgi:hypothetical protein
VQFKIFPSIHPLRLKINQLTSRNLKRNIFRDRLELTDPTWNFQWAFKCKKSRLFYKSWSLIIQESYRELPRNCLKKIVEFILSEKRWKTTWVGSLFNYRVIVAHQMRGLSPHTSEYAILHVVSLYGKYCAIFNYWKPYEL